MPIAEKQGPVRFTPRGLVDALDATDKFPGACLSLQNLVFDQSNPEIVIARAGVGNPMTSFAGFTTPGFVSVQVTIADRVYGMLSTGRNAGRDEPFVYDHALSQFVTVTGVTGANSPVSPATSGDWTPPTMASIGNYIIVTHPGFAGGANKIGWFDLTNPAAPVWNAGDVGTNALPSVPTSVANFNNRAYYACANTEVYSDVLAPLTRTSSTQALTIGDSSAIVAQSGLPIQTTSSGVIGALLVFKENQIWQITGDPATGFQFPLALNYLSLNIGTGSPRSIAQCPFGVYFAAPNGPYIVNNFGIVQPVSYSAKEYDSDVSAPWGNATFPSRIAAAYASGIYRICMQTIVAGVATTNDYWFDEKKRRWNGPHTFTYDCASVHQDHFILSGTDHGATLFHHHPTPSLSSSYADNGTQIYTVLESSLFPKTGSMEMNQVVESTIELASGGAAAFFYMQALDDVGNSLSACNIETPVSGSLWGSAIWGAFNWFSSIAIPTTYIVPWTAQLVFKKMKIEAQAAANGALCFGTFFCRYQQLGYTLQPVAVPTSPSPPTPPPTMLNTVYTVNTVVATADPSIAYLKGLPVGTYQTVEVLGYSAQADGGGGVFWWNATDTTPDNGSTVIAPTAGGTGRWNLLNDYLPAGAGAVPTDVPAKLREVYSIYDKMSPAQKADAQAGTMLVDCSTAFSVINDAHLYYVPDGTYRFDSVAQWTTTGPSFVGETRRGAILKAKSGLTEPQNKGLLTWISVNGVSVENLTIDGNGWSTSVYADSLIRFELSNHLRVLHCDLTNNPNMGISGYGISDFEFSHNYIHLATARNVDNDGIAVVKHSNGTLSGNGEVVGNELANTGSLFNATDIKVNFNRIYNWKFGSGITTGIWPESGNVELIGNQIWGGTGVDSNALVSTGVELYGDNPRASLNLIYNCDGPGMIVGGRNGMIANNTILNCGLDPGATHFSGLLADYVDANVNANGTVFIGNTSSGSSQAYGISSTGVAPYASNCYLIDNNFNGNMTASENILGAGWKVTSPRLYGSVAWNPGLIATGAISVQTVAVTGARLGDYVEASIDKDLQNCTINGYVSASDAVAAVITNLSGAGKTIASGTLRVSVMKRVGYAPY